MTSNSVDTTPEATRKKIAQIYGDADYKTRSEVLTNPIAFRKVGNEYQKIKIKFMNAAKNRSKDNWLDAKIAYKKYIETLYPLDIDALSEYSSICMHYALYEKDEAKRDLIFKDAILFREWTSRLEYKNPWHKIKLGQNYRIAKKNDTAIKNYEELSNNDPENIIFKLNLASLYIAQSGSGDKESQKENFNKLEKILADIKSLDNNHPTIGTITESLKRLKINQKPLDLPNPRNTKDNIANSSLNETRLGVLLYLKIIGHGALASEIKQEWLVNNETTRNTLSQMTQEGLLVEMKLTSGNNAYSLSEDGKTEVKDWYKAIDTFLKDDSEKVSSWIDDAKKDDGEMHGGFSKRFLKKFNAWNKNMDNKSLV